MLFKAGIFSVMVFFHMLGIFIFAAQHTDDRATLLSLIALYLPDSLREYVTP
jgi:hypothetical protein